MMLRNFLQDRARVIWIDPRKLQRADGEVHWGTMATRTALRKILALPNAMAITSHTVAGWFHTCDVVREKMHAIPDQITEHALLGQALGWLARPREM